jgi:hypothetical protein
MTKTALHSVAQFGHLPSYTEATTKLAIGSKIYYEAEMSFWSARLQSKV